MASAYPDPMKGGFIADFRGPHAPGKKRKHIRIPRQRCETQAEADAYAAECERYARILEGLPTAADIEHAVALKVIKPDQADAMRQGRPVAPGGADDESRPWTLERAAEAHPATRHEKTQNPADYRKHLKQLAAFTSWTGSQLLASVTLEQVLGWVDQLRADGMSWDTRRHYLLYLRRATQMGASQARLPDVIGGLVLDRKGQDPQVIESWTLDQIVSAALILQRSKLWMNVRAPGVIALGGCLGLRPSEIARLTVGDLVGDVIRVGVQKRKNRQSRRDLPIPAAVLPWIQRLALHPKTGAQRPPTAPLVMGKRKGHLSHHALNDWWNTTIRPHLPSPHLSIKHLRKTFTDWAIGAEIRTWDVESNLGHRHSEISSVTGDHYLPAARVAQLRPTAQKLSDLIASSIQRTTEALTAANSPPPTENAPTAATSSRCGRRTRSSGSGGTGSRPASPSGTAPTSSAACTSCTATASTSPSSTASTKRATPRRG